jgi:uncharacterized protein YggU (UPF0235/DUF167 family)
MSSRPFHLHDGKTGAAIAVRITPRASKNAIIEILSDGTVKVHLTASGDEKKLNQALTEFLSSVLELPSSNLEVVAGISGNDKLVSILNLDAHDVQARIIKSIH